MDLAQVLHVSCLLVEILDLGFLDCCQIQSCCTGRWEWPNFGHLERDVYYQYKVHRGHILASRCLLKGQIHYNLTTCQASLVPYTCAYTHPLSLLKIYKSPSWLLYRNQSNVTLLQNQSHLTSILDCHLSHSLLICSLLSSLDVQYLYYAQLWVHQLSKSYSRLSIIDSVCIHVSSNILPKYLHCNIRKVYS